MSPMRFLVPQLRESAAKDWLSVWSSMYPEDYDSEEYEDLIRIAKIKSFTADDFERIGKWKDRVKTDLQWKPNVASVAYLIWKEAGQELPRCPGEGQVSTFLNYWSSKAYMDVFTKTSVEKHFGPPRATTLLHFLSGGRFPIFDRRVRTAFARLHGCAIPPNTVAWYLDSYCKFFSELAVICDCVGDDSRILDKALFSYGAYETLTLSVE